MKSKMESPTKANNDHHNGDCKMKLFSINHQHLKLCYLIIIM